MSKNRLLRKRSNATAHHRDGHLLTGQGVEETEEFDDSPLPSAEELERIHALDLAIVTWLMARAEQEQQFRHEQTGRRQEIAACVFEGETHINKSAIHWGGLIMMACLAASTFLIYTGHTVVGSVFGGTVIIVAVSLFVNRSMGKKTHVGQESVTTVAKNPDIGILKRFL